MLSGHAENFAGVALPVHRNNAAPFRYEEVRECAAARDGVRYYAHAYVLY